MRLADSVHFYADGPKISKGMVSLTSYYRLLSSNRTSGGVNVSIVSPAAKKLLISIRTSSRSLVKYKAAKTEYYADTETYLYWALAQTGGIGHYQAFSFIF